MVIKGKGVCPEINFGKIHFYDNEIKEIKRYSIEKPSEEIKRLRYGILMAKDDLDRLYNDALDEVGKVNAEVFSIHKMMLEDEDYTEFVENIITTQKVNSEYALAVTSDNFSKTFLEMDDEYMRARASDIKDVSNRVIGILTGRGKTAFSFDEPVIIVAKDLTPGETVQLDKSKVAGFVTEQGSDNSHTAILARSMGIPAIVNTGKTDRSAEGKFAVIDGERGECIVEPDEETIRFYKEKKKSDDEKLSLLKSLSGKETVTKDGRKIKLYANIGSPEEVKNAVINDAEGIGLFRSEFLYLDKDRYPTEEEQFESYRSVVTKMGAKPVIIRTLDIGADKKIDYFDLPEEENPAMGYRAIRICLDRKELFKTQLRAIFRASVFGNVSVMFPMITSVEEIYNIKAIVREVKNELISDGIPFDDGVKLGIMIETPASALISDVLAKEVDFFSVGTNDLTQYTLACDRQNEKISSFVNPHHTAVLRLIEMTVKNAHKENIWVGICGELAADMTLTETFIQMGVDELSVSSPYILKIRGKVRNL